MNKNIINKMSYDKIAGKFSATRNYVWADIDLLLSYIKNNDNVLDLGCGNGRILERLKDKEVIYQGVDFSKGLIDEARKKFPNNNFKVEDILNLKLNKKFDVIISVSTINHFSKKYQQKAISVIKEHLNKDGYLLLINWNLWNLSRKKSIWRVFHKRGFRGIMTTWKSGDLKAKLYYYAFTLKSLKTLLEKNNFEILENFYSKKGNKSDWKKGDNIITIAKLK